MNIDKFVETLPDQYDNWGTLDVFPKHPIHIQNIWALGTETTHALMNYAVQCLEEDEVYMEVGVLQGATVVSALFGNEARAIAVDNFSLLPSTEGNKIAFERKMVEERLTGRVKLYEIDFVDFFKNPPKEKVGVYFHDGPHGYEMTYIGLEDAIPMYADRCVIVMDDFNWDGVREATFDWIKTHSDNVKILFDLQTPTDSKAWWNGLGVMEWRK